MSEPAITLAALAQFHRDEVVPDFERIVAASALRLRDEMHSLHDAVLSKLDRLEFEYQALKAGLARVEARLNSVEERLRGVEERLDGVERRLDTLEAGHRDLVASVHRLDERLRRVEKRLDELVAAHAAYASTDEVQELRQRLEGLQARVEAIEKKMER